MVLLHLCQAPLDFMLSGRLDCGEPVGLGLIPEYNLCLMICETLDCIDSSRPVCEGTGHVRSML